MDKSSLIRVDYLADFVDLYRGYVTFFVKLAEMFIEDGRLKIKSIGMARSRDEQMNVP